MTAILSQVKLLRGISAEFSNFASSPTPHPAPTSLADLLTTVVEPYRTGLDGRVDIRIDVAPTLPVVNVDRTLLARALTNVIENALHAMPGAGMLSLTADRNGQSVRLSVSDTGGGMDNEALRRVFEPYFSTQGDRDRARPAHRQAQRRAPGRDDRAAIRAGPRDDGHDGVPGIGRPERVTNLAFDRAPGSGPPARCPGGGRD